MKTDVRTLYPNAAQDDYFSVYGYQPMIDSFGKVLVQVDDRDYQGDTRVLVEDTDGFFGFLVFGWGSCSGCDALQMCENYNDLQKLYDSLKGCIKWFDDAWDTRRFFETHDWEGDYTFHQKETQEFVEKCKDLLAKRLTGTASCEKNPLDCGNRTWCYEVGGCCHESLPVEATVDRWNNDLLLEDADSEAEDAIAAYRWRCPDLPPDLTDEEYAEMQKRDYLEGRIGLEDEEDAPQPGSDADRWYEQKIAEAEAEYAEIDALVKSKAGNLLVNEKKVSRMDPKFEDAVRDALGFEPRPLKTFVWTDVLCDYTDGIVVAVARDLEEALRLVRCESESGYDAVKNLTPIVVEKPVAFVVHGGS